MTYRVFVLSNSLSFIVTDQPIDYDSENGDRPWPPIVEFPITQRHDKNTQLRRAREYAAYLNSHNVIIPAIGAPV